MKLFIFTPKGNRRAQNPIVDYLRLKGHRVTKLTEAEQLNRYLQAEIPDCVILDIVPPNEMLGMAFVEFIRIHYARLPIIVYVSLSRLDARQITDAKANGANGLFDKRLSLSELHDGILAVACEAPRPRPQYLFWRGSPTESPLSNA